MLKLRKLCITTLQIINQPLFLSLLHTQPCSKKAPYMLYKTDNLKASQNI